MPVTRARKMLDAVFAAAAFVLCFAITTFAYGQTVLLNVSYDPTRELYKEVNAAFAAEWKAQTGESVTIRMSHGGSGGQARAVIDGLNADVVTLALSGDIDEIAKRTGKIAADWQKKFPQNSAPYTSTIVFLVRKGNPKGIKDWGDLAKPGIGVITPNPKTSGGARWNYLAAWAWAQREYQGDDAKIRAYITAVLKNVPVLDTGARGATTTFAQRGLGDVLLAWENEAFLSLDEFGKDNFDIITPSVSILAEPPVAVVEGNVGPKKALAEAYLRYLYAPKAQGIAAKHHYRPINVEAADPKHLALFKQLELVTIDKDFGGWAKAQREHFGENGTFDQLYGKK